MIRRILAGAIFAGPLLAAQPGHARTLSSPLVFPDGESQLLCSVVNADASRAIVVRSDAVGFDGAVVRSSDEQALQPGQVGGVNVPASEGARYCRFEIVQGIRRAVRAAACVFQIGVGCISTAAAN